MYSTNCELYVTIYNEWVNDFPVGEGTIYLLDLDYDKDILINMSVADVIDIFNRTTTYSETFEIPDTPNNRKIFGFISELNYDSFLFNPNKRADCQILIDKVVTYRGTISLNSIKTNYKSGDRRYICNFQSNLNNFYKNIGEKYLTDLTGLDSCSHIYNLENIIHSWTQSYGNGYYYPLIDYGKIITLTNSTYTEIASGFNINSIGGTLTSTSSVTIDQMYPAVYVRRIIDQIFYDSGYDYISNFFNDNLFNNLIIPFSNNYLKASYKPIDVNYKDILFGTSSTTDHKILWHFDLAGIMPIDQYMECLSLPSITSKTQSFIHINNEVPYYYNELYNFSYYSGTFSSINSYFENTNNFDVYVKPLVSLNLTATYSIPGYTFQEEIFDYPYEIAYYSLYMGSLKNGSATSSILVSTDIALMNINRIGCRDNYFTSNGESDVSKWNNNEIADWGYGYDATLFQYGGYYKVEPGEKVYIFLGHIDMGPGSTFSFSIKVDDGSYVNWQYSDRVYPGGKVGISNNLPANIKQKDFLKSIYRMFNLYLEEDKLQKSIRVEPRDDYYREDKFAQSVVILDWTNKVDLSEGIKMDLLSNINKKTIIYTYKEGKEYFNSYYKSITNRICGDVIKEVNNDFSYGDNKLDLIFSPSIMANIPGCTNFPVVNYSKQISDTLGYPVGSTDLGVRILQKNQYGIVDIPSGEYWTIGTQSGSGDSYTVYPYAGNYDDPFNPTFDINFNQELVTFYYQPNITNNNLYNNYYKNQFDEITDNKTRILKCKVYLNQVDIDNLYFNYIIYIELGGQGSYWRINSINGFNTMKVGTCDLELVRVLKINA